MMDGAAVVSREAAIDTGLECFCAIARHAGIDLSPDRLRHDHALPTGETGPADLLRVAEASGFRARRLRLSWGELAAGRAPFPLLAPLANGNSVVLVGFRPDDEGGKVEIVDPLADPPGVIELGEAAFCASWLGEAVAFSRAYALKDEAQPFGFRWFVPELLRQRRVFRDVAVAALALQVLGLALPIFVQIVLDKVLVHQAYATLYVLLVGIVGALGFEALFGFLRRYLLLHGSRAIDLGTSTRSFARLLSLPIAFFERVPAGVLVKHMQQVDRIREFLTGRLLLTLLDAAVLFVVVPVLFLYSPLLATLVLACAGLVALLIAALVGPFRRRLAALYAAEGERQAYLVETIGGMATVKGLAIEPLRRRDWDRRCAEAIESHFRLGKIAALAQSATGLLEKLQTVLVIGVGAEAVFGGTLSVGALIAFQMLAGRVTGALGQIVALVHEYQETALSVGMLGEIMNRPPERAGSRGLRAPIRGDIELDEVSFRYGESGAAALDRLTMRIPAGSVFGIVGRSGSGKTTLTRLLRGMYPLQAGAIRIDGHDLREFDLAHLRSSIGIVLQESFLFRGSVRDNIAAPRPEATLEAVVEAATAAGAHEFIQALPQGYDTQLEESGANLSGGQRQRLAIARALIRDPRILILDEATSALDPESEALVQKNLARIAAGRTVIIVSHRLASLVSADAILVLDRGRAVDYGRHGELLGRCTSYRQLWNQQHRHLR